MKPALSAAVKMALISLAVSASAGQVAIAASRFSHSDWSRVGRLPRGSVILLTLKGSEPAKRHFVASDESTLTVLSPTDLQRPIEIRRDDVAEIKAWQKDPGRYVWWGALIGGTWLAVAFRRAEANSPGCQGHYYNSCWVGRSTVYGAVTGGFLGAAGGGVTGALVPRRAVVIYRSR